MVNMIFNSSTQSIFSIKKDGNGKILFTQVTEYKTIEILSCDLLPSSEEALRKHITYQYNLAKGKMLQAEQRLEDMDNLLRLKNPSLLQELIPPIQPEVKPHKRKIKH